MDMAQVQSFVYKFQQLWAAGETVHLDLDTHAGKAWVYVFVYSLVTKYTSNNSILPVHHSTEVQHIIEDRTGDDKQHDLLLQKPRTQVTAQKLTKLQLLLRKRMEKIP